MLEMVIKVMLLLLLLLLMDHKVPPTEPRSRTRKVFLRVLVVWLLLVPGPL